MRTPKREDPAVRKVKAEIRRLELQTRTIRLDARIDAGELVRASRIEAWLAERAGELKAELLQDASAMAPALASGMDRSAEDAGAELEKLLGDALGRALRHYSRPPAPEDGVGAWEGGGGGLAE